MHRKNTRRNNLLNRLPTTKDKDKDEGGQRLCVHSI